MKQIVLERLTLRNFKGIRDFTLDARGVDVNVYGDNAVGKTTLFDAWTWLLFGKDSANQANFEIKTLLSDGTPIHNLEHEVEAVLSIDGRRTTLRRVYKEVWTKKRGSATAEFSGHTTDYFVDGVPVKKGEYEAAVAAIVDEQLFRLLTDPRYFNEVLKWQDRRKILLEICGDLTDDEVIASDRALADLPAILDGRTIEQHRKMVAAKRKEINEQLERIPVRIDEATRSIPELPEESEQFYESHIDELRDIIRMKQEEIVRIQSGGEVTAKQNRIREIEGEMLELKNRLQGDTLEKIAAARREETHLRMEIEDLQRQIDALERRINQNEMAIQLKGGERERLRQKWYEVDGRKFEGHQHDETCAACGQPLPAEKIAEARRKAEEQFNLEKARELESITRAGKALATEIEALQAENESAREKIETLRADLQVKKEAHAAAVAALSELEASRVDVTADPSYQAKLAEIDALRAEIASLQRSTTQAVAAIRAEIAGYEAHIAELEREKAKFELAEAARRRITELEQREKELSAEFERLERELHLLDEFTRTKVDLLESRINSKFRLARFKLFREQINGGLEETCEVMVDGVPYSSLNNAARHNVGLDIISTLSEHFGICAPIFIDNAESITRPLDTPGQQIRLIVSAADKQLRVEVETEAKTMKEAV
jgi:DNA repair exonuclease SbcCD ATPase subunit